MAKEETIQLEGKVIDVLPNTMFRIAIENLAHPVIGYISGRMRKHDIKILLGDNVLIDVRGTDCQFEVVGLPFVPSKVR
jgi:translation initiation factor IF-1